jgi:autotransporter-associated beta strand protein
MGNNWFTDENWSASPAPDSYDTANVVFGDSKKTYVNLYDNSASFRINAHGLTFNGNTRPYYLDGNGDGYLTLHLGAGGINYTPAQPVRSTIATDFELHASQTWNIASGTLVFAGSVYDGDNGYTFTKTGAGTLVFNSSDNEFYTSTLNLNNGRLVLSASSYYYYGPLGAADLVIGPATLGNNPILVANDNSNDDKVTLGNKITLNGALTTENKTELSLTGPVTLNADTTITTKGSPLIIEGAIGEATAGKKLSVNSNGAVILVGANTYTGGTSVTKGVLVFENNLAIPTAGQLSAASSGYIGRLFDPTGATLPLATYLAKFDLPNTHGTIGFDTDPELKNTAPASAFNNFSEAINLTGFASDARLGSATQAIISGIITPQGANYQFGGGGGLLIVSSLLTGSGAVTVDSPVAAPLTVGLGSLAWNSGTLKFDPATHAGNSLTGGVSVRYSAVVFGPGAMPTSGNFTLQDGGYIGNGDNPGITPTAFLTRFPTTTDRGMIGFDYFGDGTATISGAIDLTRFTGGSVYLGTTTQAVLSGTITPQGSTYRFGAYKTGELEVASPLADARNVIIGDPTSPATFGDYFAREYATVKLTGNNSYTGGTTLNGGRLMVGQSNGVVGTDATTALGTGSLTVNAFPFPTAVSELFTENESPSPRLEAANYNLIVPNALVLNTGLSVGGNNYFTLAGNITGTGGLYVGEDSPYYGFTLTLTGNNTFNGGVYVASGATVNAGTDTALGTGSLGFGYSGGRVNFQTTAPVIGNLLTKDDSDYANLYATLSNTVLTINQSVDGRFRGGIQSSVVNPDDSLRVVKTGAGTLRLDSGGLYFYHGTVEAALPGTPQVSLQINQGTLVLSNYAYIEGSAPTIWVHGGTLALDHNHYPVYNPLVVDNNGRLAGNGTFASSVSIGTGAILSPGLTEGGAIGTLAFDRLELNSGGVLEWQILDPNSAFGHDQIDISTPTTLVVNATSLDRFTLKVISLALDGSLGLLDGFDPSQPYTWTVFNSDYTTGFDPAKFNIDASQFTNSLSFNGHDNGFFSLSETGSSLVLNFTPVPEPSTYALLALGLGLVAVSLRRRRA